MTDVEAKTPTKRRISDKGEKKGPANSKKAKFTSMKQNKPNNIQNSKNVKKNKSNSESENGSPKKLKPFVGTSQIPASNKQQEGAKKVSKQNKPNGEPRKPKNRFFVSLKDKIQSDEKETALKSVVDKIIDIEGRDVISKTAKKKLKLLYKLKSIADGKSGGQQNVAGNKLGTKNRLEGKKKGLEVTKTQQSNLGKKAVAKTQVKGVQKQANESDKKVLQGKIVNKKIKQETAVATEESSDDDEESDNELEEDEDSDEVEEEGVEGESDDEDGVEGESDDEDEEDSNDENGEGDSDEDDDDDSEEDAPPPQVEESDKKVPIKKLKKSNEKANNKHKTETSVNLEDLKNNKLVGKNQKRFVLFVGNIPYDTNKHDLMEHFQKSGEIKHIRIPTEKKSSKPRGFAYVELGNEESYQKCLSMHHTFLKGRRINVLYTQGGKKKGEEKKKEIKAKNFKLHAMRKEGKLAGSKKENQKRSFRRAKQQKAQQNNNKVSLDANFAWKVILKSNKVDLQSSEKL